MGRSVTFIDAGWGRSKIPPATPFPSWPTASTTLLGGGHGIDSDPWVPCSWLIGENR